MSGDPFQHLRGQSYMCLTSYKRDGTPIPTTVWFALDGDRLLMRTDSESFKVKRIASNATVSVAPSTARGEVRGPAVAGEARRLSAEEGKRIARMYLKRYPIGYTFEIVVLRPLHAAFAALGIGKRRGSPIFYEILWDGAAPPATETAAAGTEDGGARRRTHGLAILVTMGSGDWDVVLESARAAAIL